VAAAKILAVKMDALTLPACLVLVDCALTLFCQCALF